MFKVNECLGKFLMLPRKEIGAGKVLLSNIFNGELVYETKDYEDKTMRIIVK